MKKYFLTEVSFKLGKSNVRNPMFVPQKRESNEKGKRKELGAKKPVLGLKKMDSVQIIF